MTLSPKLPKRILFQKLANTRQMTSLIDKEFISGSGFFTYQSDNWVRMWVDPQHAVTADEGDATATRAITQRGELLWLVRSPTKRHGYHARTPCPFDAIALARRAWAGRARVRADWSAVKATARDLVIGRKRFDVTLEDAHRSPLCALGIEEFMARFGLARVTRISGRLAGLLMLVEPQLGFVIHAADARHRGAMPPVSAAVPAE